MKKIFFLAASVCLFSCNNEKPAEQKEVEKATETPVALPLKMNYEGTASIGNSANTVAVMNFNSDFIAGKLDNIGSYLADSVHAVFADGNEMNVNRDTMVAVIKAWRGSMTSAQQTYISAMAVDVKEKGHEWVFQWLDETHEYKDGKKDHQIFHEDYRMENGKIREVYQYAQAVPAKK